MTVSSEDRRHLEEQIAEVTDERAARTMSELFDEDDEDPGILARFDQQDAMLDEHGRMLAEHGRRLAALEHGLEHGLDGVRRRLDTHDQRFDQVIEVLELKLDAMRYEVLSTFRGDIQHAVNGQWRTVMIGMGTLGVVLVASAVAFAQLLA